MVGKQELLDRVWGRPDANPEGIEEGNIARQIYELRSALGDTRSDAKFIVNVHGRGYQFVAHVTERIVEKETRGRAPAPSIADRPSEVASQGLPKSPNGSLVGVGNGREKGRSYRLLQIWIRGPSHRRRHPPSKPRLPEQRPVREASLWS